MKVGRNGLGRESTIEVVVRMAEKMNACQRADCKNVGHCISS